MCSRDFNRRDIWDFVCSRDFNRRDIWDFVCVAAISIAGIFGLYLRARVAATRSIAEIFGL